jgi:hypothetical protein
MSGWVIGSSNVAGQLKRAGRYLCKPRKAMILFKLRLLLKGGHMHIALEKFFYRGKLVFQVDYRVSNCRF